MFDALSARRSIRQYTDRDIEPRVIEQLKEAILRAPSSRGIRPWRFVFVEDPALLDVLSRAKTHGASFLAEARLGVVICADESLSVVWIEDCAIAGIIVQLAATSLGLGSCWVQIRLRHDQEGQCAEERVRDALGLAPNLRVDSVISIGYPAKQLNAIPREQLPWDRIESR